MSGIQIKRGTGKPDPEKIRKHKNFARLLTDHEKATKPLYKRLLYRDKRGLLALLLILLLTILIFEFAGEDETPPPDTKDSLNKNVSK